MHLADPVNHPVYQDIYALKVSSNRVMENLVLHVWLRFQKKTKHIYLRMSMITFFVSVELPSAIPNQVHYVM